MRNWRRLPDQSGPGDRASVQLVKEHKSSSRMCQSPAENAAAVSRQNPLGRVAGGESHPRHRHQAASRGAGKLEVRLSEARHALVRSWRIEDVQVQIHRLSNPAAQDGVIGEIVVGQRMHQGPQAGRFDLRKDMGKRTLEKMHFKLRDRVRTDAAVHHSADEDDMKRVGCTELPDEAVAQRFGRRALLRRIIDMGMVGRFTAGHRFRPDLPRGFEASSRGRLAPSRGGRLRALT